MAQHAAWPDRYRPTALDQMALSPELRERFAWFLVNGLPRHLVLSGPPGCGKTTIVRIITQLLYDRHRVLSVKTTETGNVDYIRGTVIEFMRSLGFTDGGKLVVFEEATGLSREGQEALRVPLEEWADLCHVIFITNEPATLDPAVRSRCDEIIMERPPLDECARVLERVLAAEGLAVEAATVRTFVQGHFATTPDGDLRTLLSAAQREAETTGQLPAPPEEPLGSLVDLWMREPSRDVTDGAKMLTELADQFRKYLVLPPGGVEALALWTVFAWAHEAFGVSPILTLASPTIRAGKTTAFEMLEQLLIPDITFHPSSVTPATIFRLKGLAGPGQNVPATEFGLPTLCLLMDEADDWITLRPELKAILDSGWKRRGAIVGRMIGQAVGWFSSWYPKAMALVNRADAPVPSSLRDRSIVVQMQRKAKHEVRVPFPHHHEVSDLVILRHDIFKWVREHFSELRTLGAGALLAPSDLHDRAKDNWQPLLVIAHVAGGGWEERARRASLAVCEDTADTELLLDLLHDIRSVFANEGTDAIRSATLHERLLILEDRPWKELRLSPSKVARMLRPLGIKPGQLWMDKRNRNGYKQVQFKDAFARYL